VLLAAGCAKPIPPPRESIGPEARRAIDLLAHHWEAFTDLRALADITARRGPDGQSLTGVLLLKRPGSVRFEALSAFGPPFLFAVIHEGQLTTYSAGTNEAVVGPATADTTARLLGLPFEPHDLVSVMTGLATPPTDLRAAEVLPPDTDGPSLTLYGAANRKRVWLDLETGVVRQQEIVGGRYEVRVLYERRPDGQVKGLRLSAAQSQMMGTVEYREAIFGAGIEPERFVFTLPADAKVQRLR